jgi:hypothetical protein
VILRLAAGRYLLVAGRLGPEGPIFPSGRSLAGRDVFAETKRRATRRALLSGGVREEDARRILSLLSSVGGCRLGTLGGLSGLPEGYLSRALGVLGLQNLITLEERHVCGDGCPDRRRVAWVEITNEGLKFASQLAPEGAPA